MRCNICGQETLLNGQCYHGATPSDILAADLRARVAPFAPLTLEDIDVINFMLLRSTRNPSSITALRLRSARLGDAMDYQVIAQVERTREQWGKLAKPDVVRASFGLDTDEFLRLLRESIR